MNSVLVALMLAAELAPVSAPVRSAALPAAEEGSAAPKSPPAPPSAADSIVAAAFARDFGTPSPSLKGEPGPGPGVSTVAVPLLAIAGLGLAAALLSRRRQALPQGIRVVESAGLGPKRSLVVVDVLGDRLVLGVSEAGIAVLSSRPAPQPAPDTIVMPPALQRGFFQRLLGRPRARPSFEAELSESLEDQELRDKLAAGMRGVVP